jgi:predicted Zn-dependent protease
MEEALKLAPADSAVLAKAASLSSAHGKWRRAKSEAEQATARDSRSISARYLLALACMKTGSLDRALDESATLVRLAPSDAASHLLRARIAEAANDPTTEADALERLLDIARTQNQPTEGIRILLGQAWARAGFPEQALQNNRAALAGELTPRQRKLIEDSIELIERRARPAR